MSVSLIVIRLELAEHSPVPAGFGFSAAAGEMSDEEIKKTTLASAVACLEGKSPGEKVAIIHQHLGRREMTDVIIETMKSNPDELKTTVEERKSSEASPTAQRSKDHSKECINTAPDSPSKQLPDQISFFSGNPSVEIVHGIMHLYKTNKMTSLKEDVRRSAMLCILTVPAAMTSHDLMKFVAPFNEVIEQMKIIRDSTPNQYMVLIKFSAQADADSFYMACNGRQFNSIEDDVCQLVYVERAEVLKSEDGASLPVMDLTELPKCTVCLERMDESVNGILTTLCNHSFHSQCLQRWDDTTCPVCRYCQTPEPVEENKCFECGVQEYSYLLTSQLESQRIYWENKIVRIEKDTAEEINNMKTKFKETIEKCDNLEHKLNDLLKEKQSVERRCTQLNTKVAKLTNELKEEQEMNKCLRANQVLLQNKLKEEERVLKETCDQKDLQITEIQEQLRDVMFYLETQQKINHLPAETRQEIQEGQINIAMASASSPASSGGSGKLSSRKGRSKRGK
ncbi:BRCA1-associated protein isoform X5 [Macaca fascicularis]|uniref:BRCA1-associated protein isoform X3 n=2 Tax=Macaca TaxID=9539 RepID=UPI0010A1FB39|nr:BRCA1-associated protein isoform X3 [Macaca mulatta]XP_045221904.1 BRCA1-associated protein isoform X4 [Macaca fascicularis]